MRLFNDAVEMFDLLTGNDRASVQDISSYIHRIAQTPDINPMFTDAAREFDRLARALGYQITHGGK